MVPPDFIHGITTVVIYLLSGTVLSVLCVFLLKSSQHHYEIGTIIPILHVRKPKLREVKKFSQGHAQGR